MATEKPNIIIVAKIYNNYSILSPVVGSVQMKDKFRQYRFLREVEKLRVWAVNFDTIPLTYQHSFQVGGHEFFMQSGRRGRGKGSWEKCAVRNFGL